MSAIAVPEKAPDDSSKLKTFLSILRKYATHGLPPRIAALRNTDSQTPDANMIGN